MGKLTGMAKKKSCPLVLIEWEDSAQPIAAWQHLIGLSLPGVVRCVSVGWLVRDGKKVKALAPNMGEISNPSNAQVSGVIQIPSRCVIKIHVLQEPALSK